LALGQDRQARHLESLSGRAARDVHDAQGPGERGPARVLQGVNRILEARNLAEVPHVIHNPGQKVDGRWNPVDTAVVSIDPQNDVVSEKVAAWAAVGESVTENKTVENMERILRAAKQRGFEVFISPHYFYPTDSGWKFNGPLETGEFADRVFARRGALNLD